VIPERIIFVSRGITLNRLLRYLRDAFPNEVPLVDCYKYFRARSYVSFVLMWKSPATRSEPSDVGWRCVWNEYVAWVIVAEGRFERKKKRDASAFYIHGSVHRESNLITVQQDATVFSLLYLCRQPYMFRVLTPIIRSSYSCNCSCTSSWWWVSSHETCRAAYRSIINLIQSHLVGQLLNVITVLCC
jgi:hypothetical protein